MMASMEIIVNLPALRCGIGAKYISSEATASGKNNYWQGIVVYQSFKVAKV